MTPDAPLLRVRGLRVAFPTAAGLAEAVRGVDLDVRAGEAVGLVGESGSGKSVTALAIMRLVAAPGRIVGGEIRFDGEDLVAVDEARLREIRGRGISMVFQDPLTSLNPSFTVGQQLVDVIRAHRAVSARSAMQEAEEALRLVGIPDPGRRLSSYPHQFSGGMRQRVLIAMAIACRPRLLIADEPTTALDVTIQAQVMDLLRTLRKELGLALLFITHNLDLMAESCDRAIVLYGGRVMEEAGVRPLFESPSHPYTRLLMRSIPRLSSRGTVLRSIDGSPPTLGRMGAGCPFAPRCPEATDRCRETLPTELGTPGRRVACWARAAS